MPAGPGKYDAFATCLKDKGAVFYGAFWCPHCQATKKLFGSSEKLLPYVECSTPDANGQTQICIDKKIVSYPTWEFKDGSRLNGELSLQQLSDKTACVLPS
jgi:thiol-disulfide isomerase/thioredoxin